MPLPLALLCIMLIIVPLGSWYLEFITTLASLQSSSLSLYLFLLVIP